MADVEGFCKASNVFMKLIKVINIKENPLSRTIKYSI